MSTVTIQEAFALAIQRHQAGRLAEAEALYRQILAVQPQHADALHHLGMIAHQSGRHDLAVEWIRQAIVLNPDNHAAHSNLGATYQAMGQLDEAIASFRRALDLERDSPEANLHLAGIFTQRSEFDEAVVHYRRVLELQPHFPDVHLNLGVILAAQGRLDEAAAAYRRALQLRPDYPEAHNGLGVALAKQGQLDEATVAYHRALQLRPDYPEARNNLGDALTKRGQIEEAIAEFGRALQLKPDYFEAHLNLSAALAEQGQFEPAVAACRHALQLRPSSPEAYLNLGNVLKKQGQSDEAFAAYHRVLQLKPNFPDCHYNLANLLRSQGEFDKAMAFYRQAIDLDSTNARFLSMLIYGMHFCPGCDASSIREEQARWNRLYVEPLRPSWRPHANDPDPRRRLKIGYVSPDFHAHPVSFFIGPLLEAHDRRQCETYCYASVHRPDAVTKRLRQSSDVWRDVHAFSDTQLAGCIRDDGIDILVDLAMHTAGNLLRVFAHRPAPVQVSWLAYPGSAGMEAIDYRITDAIIDPAGQDDAGFGGEALRLPDAWCCYAPLGDFPLVGSLPAAKTGTITFGSLHQFTKIHEGVLRCWAGLLGAVPGSRLIMICPEGHARERTYALFAACGVVRERVELVTFRPWPDYIRLFERIDLALDAFPCNGMTTTCHALWMGVPVVTLAGMSAVSRAGQSLLHTVGLPEWVARSEEQYVRIATRWATNLPRLAELRATLRPRMQASPLTDAPRFARNIETAYRTVWQRWCAARQV